MQLFFSIDIQAKDIYNAGNFGKAALQKIQTNGV